MKLMEVKKVLDQLVPPVYAMDWDNVGLMVGDLNADVTRVYLSLDCDDKAVDEAIEKGCQLILTHHPLLFRPLKTITDQDFKGKRIRKMIRHDINCFSMHTNYDVVKMADRNARDLHFQNAQLLEPAGMRDGEPYGFGRIGDLPEAMTLGAFSEEVKRAAALREIRVYGDPSTVITRAAVASGAGKSAVGDALQKGAQVLVTGDLDYHTATDALSMGLAMIDAGHYGTEYCFIDETAQMLSGVLPDLTLVRRSVEQPYHIL
ncbi:MAG: Nif3-like dinuclear metal center hexameric protein [Lachnospiraceae bacterium]|nr:Nif3-like dinuclear metal center hexameric protein [Lachnospiraceae bacterium]